MTLAPSLGRRTYARDTLTRKLIEIGEKATRMETPFRVDGVYVYGSYSRGAPRSGDLDLLIAVTFTDQKAWRDLCEVDRGPNRRDASVAAVREALLPKGISLDARISFSTSEDMLRQHLESLPTATPHPVWSREFPDTATNLAAMPEVATAGRFERPEILRGRRFYDPLYMAGIVRLVSEGWLALKRIPIDLKNPPSTKGALRVPMERALQIFSVGKETARLWPYALHWLRRDGRTVDYPDRCALSTGIDPRAPSGRDWILLGNPSLFEVPGRLAWTPDETYYTRAVALLPAIRVGEPNEILVFTRGPSWGTRKDLGAPYYMAYWNAILHYPKADTP